MAKRYATHLTTPTGARVYVSGKTKEELEKKVLQAKIEMRAGVDIADDTRFADYARTWLKAYKAPPKVRESTYVVIKSTLDSQIIPFFGEMKLQEVKPMQVQLFLTAISHLSRGTQTRCIQYAKAIFRTAEDNGLILRTPFRKEDKPSGNPTKEREPLTNEEVKTLLNAVRGTRAYGFCLIALSTGMRRGEILGLMWEDVDLEAGIIEVRHNKAFVSGKKDSPVTTMLKTDAAKRRIPIPVCLKEYLMQEKARANSPYVVCMKNGQSLTQTSYTSLWHTASARLAAVGIKCHPHLLRHTYLTQLFEQGLDIKQVQYLAGHSTPDMTMRVYTHYREKTRAEETSAQVLAAMSYLNQSTAIRPHTVA